MAFENRQLYSTGPVALFVTQAYGKKVVCLGTGERAPLILERREFVPVRTDRSGRVARARIYGGAEARIVVTLTRWDEAAFAYLQRSPSKNSERGTEGAGDVGVVFGVDHQEPLWLLFPNATLKPMFSTLPKGYRFPCAALEGPLEFQPGTGRNSRVLTWEAQQVKDDDGNLVLFDHDLSGLDGIDWP